MPWGVGLRCVLLPVSVVLRTHTTPSCFGYPPQPHTTFLPVWLSSERTTSQTHPWTHPPVSYSVSHRHPPPRVFLRLLIGGRVFFGGAVQSWSTLPPPPHRQAHHGTGPPAGNIVCVLPFSCSPVARSSCLSFRVVREVLLSTLFFVCFRLHFFSFPG